MSQCGRGCGVEARTALVVRLRRLQQVPQRPVALAAVALERSWYLDEIERRFPDDFAGWLRTLLP